MPTLRGSASDPVQCRVSSRSTKLVQVRASCRRYDFRAGLRASLANCVRSDARRRQSRSSLSNCSDFDIAHRLESSMRSVTRSRVLSVAYATHENKKAPVRRSYNAPRCGICLQRKSPATQRSFSESSRPRLRRFGGGIRRINQARFPTLATANSTCYAASLHCAFTSFDALLRWTCWSTWSTHPTGMR
jgi:hypothetical protein